MFLFIFFLVTWGKKGKLHLLGIYYVPKRVVGFCMHHLI